MPSLTTWAPFCPMALPMWTMLSAWSKQSHGCSWQGNKPHRNSPEPSEPCLRNLHQHAPELFGTLRNLPRPSGTNLSEPSGTYASIRRNPPEPSRNLPPEPTPAHAGTLRNLPEPSSGTCSCDPHRHTPELIWAEDPISLRCWGRIIKLLPCRAVLPAHGVATILQPSIRCPQVFGKRSRCVSCLQTQWRWDKTIKTNQMNKASA